MISNWKVYGLNESITACQYPKSTDIEDISFSSATDRALKLGKAKRGSGHNNFLKGIMIQFDWKNSLSIQRQILRYNFIDIVSSQSTMHRALELDIESQCNVYVDRAIVDIVKARINDYNRYSGDWDEEIRKTAELEILYSLPTGYELTARYTTNYLQLKTIYEQRKKHKLPEWKEFCNWILTLPHFKELTGIEVE